ncbi:MAG: hypothetical protein JWO08_2672 [Verrucomicrobiaceae bacterium]|nr:hypothetical protein [Verrucomicrobiaceae bacterium]
MEKGSVYLGLSGFVPAFDELDFGDGIVLKKTYAYIFSTTMAAFTPHPTNADGTALKNPRPTPGPWVAVDGGFSFYIHAELQVPPSIKGVALPMEAVLDIILGLIRMYVRPEIFAPAISPMPFLIAKDHPNFTISSYEVNPRHTPFVVEVPEQTPAESFEYLQHHLKAG